MNNRLKFVDSITEVLDPKNHNIDLILTPNTIHDITCDNCGTVVRVATANLMLKETK
jgi:hypothetical protein